MCNPVAIGLMVAGTALQMNAQRQRQKNMQNAAEDAQQAEYMRQESLRKERESQLVDVNENATRESQDAQLDEATAKRNAAYADSTTLPGDAGTDDYQPASAAATYGQPKIIQEETDRQRSKADAEVRSVGDARARLASYGDVGLGNQILGQNTANNLNMLGSFAKGSAALLPGEVQAAMNKHAGDRRGQELLGTALSMYGGFGAPGAGGAAAGAAGGAGSTAAGYSGNLSAFTPSAGAAGAASAQAAAPTMQQGMLGGLFGNTPVGTPWWKQAGNGVGSMLASNGRTK